MDARKNWTREETIVAFSVYCRIPFKASSKTNPEVIKYANIIGRSPSALNMKIGNFGRLDPTLRSQGIVGLANGSKLDEEVWHEFNSDWSRLAYESEKIIANFEGKQLSDKLRIAQDTLPVGVEKERVVKTRVNQSFFRSAILSSYNQTCCVTGIKIPELLVASHIIPWSKDEKNRTNPRNGLCLNSLHDKAFDKGLMTIDENYKIKISDRIKHAYSDEVTATMFAQFDGKNIILPDRFLPDLDFLQYHRDNIFLA